MTDRTYYLFHSSDLRVPFNEIIASSIGEVRDLLCAYYEDTDDIIIELSSSPISARNNSRQTTT